MTESHIRNVIEAALLAAGKSLLPTELVDLFDEGKSRPTLSAIQAALAALTEEYSTRGIELKETAGGFRIQVRRELSNEISRLWPERPPKYSRALLETLALIAYRQPITRAEIEAVRGVPVNPNIIKTVIERNWVRVVGHRDVPGRPELLATTEEFLDYFGLKGLDDLPPLAELKSIGEIKVQFDLPDPGPLALASDANGAALGADGSPVDASAESVTSAVTAEGAANADAVGVGADGMADADAAGVGAADGTTAVDSKSTDSSAGADMASTDAPEVALDAEVLAAGENASANAGTDPAVAATDATTAGGSKKGSSGSRGSSRKKKGSKARSSDSALHEAEEFAASVDADLAAGDDDNSDDDELSAAGPDSSELVAGPRDIDD